MNAAFFGEHLIIYAMKKKEKSMTLASYSFFPAEMWVTEEAAAVHQQQQ